MFRSFGLVLRRRLARPWPLLGYLFLTTETHALCGALAFFAMLGFYPLSVLLLSLAKYVLRSGAAQDTVRLSLQTYFPAGQEFLLRNLNASSWRFGDGIPMDSALFILLGGAGVFIPLETAFNRLWGFGEHRPYWRNQALGLVLTLAFWALAVGLMLAVAWAPPLARGVLIRIGALVFSGSVIFLLYRFLPRGSVPGRAALPAAVGTAVAAEVVRWAFTLALPLLELQRSQGPFHVSVSFLLFCYVETFVVLTGAYLAAEATREAEAPEDVAAILRVDA